MRTAKWFLIVAVVLAAVPAWAQVDEKMINVNFGGGYTVALGEIRDHLGDGYNFTAGLTVNISPKFGIQGEYAFTGLGEKRVQLPVSPTPIPGGTDQDFFADANMHNLNVNVVIKPMGGAGKAASPYFLAGIGYYYRSIDVTTPSVGYIPGYCDPWWYVCYPGGFVPVDKIVGSRNSNDFGINFGGGVDVKLGDSAALYFEIRYHYIWGPEVKDPSGASHGNANGQFLPFTVGIRF